MTGPPLVRNGRTSAAYGVMVVRVKEIVCLLSAGPPLGGVGGRVTSSIQSGHHHFYFIRVPSEFVSTIHRRRSQPQTARCVPAASIDSRRRRLTNF
jgi:hypothetical protein